MSVIATNGPLPNDYESVNPATFLEAWISGVYIYNIGTSELKGGSLQFVYSNTDPPPLADRFPGMLWFKRGEGRLYLYDYTDDPCGPSSANQFDINWLSMSDRRDIWAHTVDAAVPGSLYFMAGTPSGTNFHMVNPTGMTTASFDPYLGRPLWTMGLYGIGSCGTSVGGNRCTGATFINLDTAISGGKCRMVEWGFCDIFVGCGASNMMGPIAYDALATDIRFSFPFNFTAYSGGGNKTVKWSYYGWFNNDPAGATGYTSGATYTRPGLKWASSIWECTGGT